MRFTLNVIIAACVGWTLLSVVVIAVMEEESSGRLPYVQIVQSESVALPRVPHALLRDDLLGASYGLNQLFDTKPTESERSERVVRMAIVLLSDSTFFVELTSLLECSCPDSEQDRFSIVRRAIDPFTAAKLTQVEDHRLSARTAAHYLNDLTQVRRLNDERS